MHAQTEMNRIETKPMKVPFRSIRQGESIPVRNSITMEVPMDAEEKSSIVPFILLFPSITIKAMKYLADRAGIELPEQEYSKEAKERADLKATIPEMNRLAAKYFYVQLKNERGFHAYRYLKDRQLSDEMI